MLHGTGASPYTSVASAGDYCSFEFNSAVHPLVRPRMEDFASGSYLAVACKGQTHDKGTLLGAALHTDWVALCSQSVPCLVEQWSFDGVYQRADQGSTM